MWRYGRSLPRTTTIEEAAARRAARLRDSRKQAATTKKRRREEAKQRRAHADSLQDGGAGRSAVASDEDSGSDSGSEN
jgi:hypothetical protein